MKITSVRTSTIAIVAGAAALPLPTQAAVNTETMNAVVESVRRVCEAPGSSGKEWKVEVGGDGSVVVSFRTIGKGSLGGQVRFSRSEWNGVQRVLREQQAADNSSYRACARELTPEFLSRINPRPKENSAKSSLTQKSGTLRLPISVIASGERVTFAPGLQAKVLHAGKVAGRIGELELETQENGQLFLREGLPVDVTFSGKNYSLVFSFNQDMQVVLMLDKKQH